MRRRAGGMRADSVLRIGSLGVGWRWVEGDRVIGEKRVRVGSGWRRRSGQRLRERVRDGLRGRRADCDGRSSV